MSRELEFLQTMKSAVRSASRQRIFEYGQITVYDPKTHTAKFDLVSTNDESDGPNAGNTPETPFIPIINLFVGPNSGSQFPHAVGALALIFFMAPTLPVAAAMLNDDIDGLPFPDGETFGWKDPKGNTITSNADGLSLTDFSGNKIQTSADGVVITSAQGWTITMNAPGITLAAPQVGVGDAFGSLGSGDALTRQSDLATTASNAHTADQTNINAIIAAIQAAGVPNASYIQAPSAAGVAAAPGSPSVRAK